MPRRTDPVVPLVLLALALPRGGVAAVPGPGDLVFSELFIDAPNADEWIEVHNPGGTSLDLDGCVMAEGADGTANPHTIGSLAVPAGAFALLSKGGDCVVWDELSSCVGPADYTYSAVTLNNSGVERLTLTCGDDLVDAVEYDGAVFDADCLGADACTVNLSPDHQDAAGNDDFAGAWCVAPEDSTFLTLDSAPSLLVTRGTPGAAGRCVQAGTLCGAGDAAFTELMIAPPSTSSGKEWFELFGTGGATCDLQGCQVLVGPDATPPATPDEAWDVEEIDSPGGTLSLDPGEHLLFASSADYVVGDGTNAGDIAADYRTSGLSLLNGEAQWIHLVCDGTVVDSAPSDWPAFEGACAQGGCSVNLSPLAYDGTANDDEAAWCVPPSESTFLNPEGDPIVATPDALGACVTYGWPAEGELALTELMVAPAEAPEWFELWNTTDRELDLTLCTIAKYRLDESGGIDPETVSESLIGEDGRTLRVAPGAVQVLSSGGCLFPDEAASDDDTTADDDSAEGGEAEGDGTCTGGEFPYSGVSFTNDTAEVLALWCPDGGSSQVVVDAAPYDTDALGIRAGHSVQFAPSEDESQTASLNDELEAWCEASFTECFLEAGGGNCNYGTPGEVGECRTDDVDWPEGGPGCRCDGSRAPRSWGALCALLAVAGGLRRRTGRGR